jgi:glycosyltransferase involved in cell wall biosynthesis
MHRAVALGVRAENLHFLPNVVDIDHFKPACRQQESKQVTLITVGRLVREKRVDRFLKVLSQLRQLSKKPVKGVIVGGGPLKSRLEQQAVELGLSPGAVELIEPVQDTGPIYRQADVLVLTSDFEGTPNVVLEAMASGLPVVATRVGGVPEVVSHGETGYLTDPGDERSMTDALLGLINSPNLRAELGNRAHDYVRANHSLTRLPRLLSELYGGRLNG